MSDTDPYAQAMRLMFGGGAHVNADQALAFATLAQVDATDRLTAAVREQTAVFRQLLDEDRAAARDLAEKAGA